SEINLKDFEITSLETKINKLKAKLEQIVQKALLKYTNTTQLLHEIKLEPNKSKIKDDIKLLIDYTNQRLKEKLDSISTLSIVMLGVSNALVNDQYIILPILKL
ncbi:37137_t:CDS:2, partial [Gigaspora margarita]